MKKINLTLIVAAGFFLLSGCSEKKDNAPVTQSNVSVHGVGFTDPASPNFHAKTVQAKNYDLQLCQSCHGTTYAGGTTGQSCNTCHNKTGGPENCTTCHGSVNAAPPKDLADHTSPTFKGVGAHQKHLSGGLLGTAVACRECHTVPAMFLASGHIDATPGAEVRFDSTSLMFRSNAVYTSSNAKCSNSYCHGNFTGGNSGTMTWTDTSSTVVACGTCHGDVTKTTLKEKAFPKTGHTFVTASADCWTCHSEVVNSSMTIINPSRHVNGKYN
jgi:predicted CxxxxCH...CXXCH cytochrome family protein